MSQEKAAALTSSLFARKGRASPASLLISELGEAGTAEKDSLSFVQDLHDRHEGEELKLSARALNGHGGRRKTKATDSELPLLAFVEAQCAAEGTPAESIAPQEQDAGAATAASASGEAEPAASLLDRGAGALRRDTGRASAAKSATDTEPPKAAEAATAEWAEAEIAPDAAVEAPTVSGDDNVTAIEDAAAVTREPVIGAAAGTAGEQADTTLVVAAEEAVEESSAVSAEQSEAIVVVPDGEAGSEGEAAETIAGQSATEPEEVKTDDETAEQPTVLSSDASQPESPAAVSAILALRKTTVLRPEPPRGGEPPVRAMPAPPRTAERALPWRSAAVVALGALLGLGAYVTLSGPGSEPPVELAVKPLAPQTTAPLQTPAEPLAGAAASRAQPDPAAAVAAASSQAPGAPEAAPLETAATAAVPQPEPSFDIIRIEPDGQSIIAGRAAPFSEWILLNNGEPIASIRADANGEWVVLPDASLVPGANAFSLVPKAEQGRVAIPEPASLPGVTPARVEPAPSQTPSRTPSRAQGEAMPEPPAATGEEGAVLAPTGDLRSEVVLPKPKPSLRLPNYSADDSGLYLVQLASVRQSADAERERQRLATAYPQLLARLDLQVQEAAVAGAGTFFRVRSGALADLRAARDLCRRLEAAGQGCLVVRRPLEPAAAAEPASEVVAKEPVTSRAPARQQAERPQ